MHLGRDRQNKRVICISSNLRHFSTKAIQQQAQNISHNNVQAIKLITVFASQHHKINTYTVRSMTERDTQLRQDVVGKDIAAKIKTSAFISRRSQGSQDMLLKHTANHERTSGHDTWTVYQSSIIRWDASICISVQQKNNAKTLAVTCIIYTYIFKKIHYTW
jgi:hypothetical protein